MNGIVGIFKSVLEPFLFVLPAFPLTVLILALTVLFGSLLGGFITYVRLKGKRVSYKIASAFISYIWGAPTIVQIFLCYYGFPRIMELFGVDLSSVDPIFFVVVALFLNFSAFGSETFRSAYLAVDKGQQEAAFSVGMNDWQTFRRIIFPQALKIGLPSYGNLVIETFKDTSLAYSIGVLDLMGKATQFITLDYGVKVVQTYLAVSLTYWAFCILLERIFLVLEAKVSKGEQYATA